MKLPALIKIADDYVKEATDNEGVITERLDEITKDLVTKTDQCAYVLDYLENMEDFFREKEQEFQRAKKSLQKAHEHLKERIKISMSALNVKELSGEYYKFQLSNCAPEVVIFDASKIPDHLCVIKKEPSKALIKETLLSGRAVPGARFEGGASLRKYVKR